MKRKQRERLGTGRVYFYEPPKPKSLVQKAVFVHGAVIPNVSTTSDDYDDFYKKAFIDIAKKKLKRQNK